MYKLTVGLEVHSELHTATKMFCACKNDPDETRPNVNVCPICMAHPGTLPVPNRAAIEHVIRLGLALGGTIPETSKFDRKNYFYPDLPKGYQISQYDMPLVTGGKLEITTKDGLKKTIRITRIHLEEDAGRLVHIIGDTQQIGSGKDIKATGVKFSEPQNFTLVDLNRAGLPLMELVTEPDFNSAEEARVFAEELQRIIQYVGASEANMEKGQMRLEANISISKDATLGTKVEVKNLNSFQSLEKGILYEYDRQKEVLESGEVVVQETRGFDDTKGTTFSQRKKEQAHDYRYFPEPDIPPLDLKSFDLPRLKLEVPELPAEKRVRFKSEYTIKDADIETITRDRYLAEYFEEAMSEFLALGTENKLLAQLLTNYLVNDFQNLLKEQGVSIHPAPIEPEAFAELIDFIGKDAITSRVAKDVLKEMMRTKQHPSTIIREQGLEQESGDALETVVSNVIAENEKMVVMIRAGKTQAIEALIGQVMRQTRGKANPKIAKELILKKLAP